MTGWEQNEDPGSFWRADARRGGRAAGRRSCATSRPTSSSSYDWHGGYGHPDHVQVHRVGHRAADLAGTPKRFEVDVQPRRDDAADGRCAAAAVRGRAGRRVRLRPRRAGRRRQPVRLARDPRSTCASTCRRYLDQKRRGPGRPRQPGHRRRHDDRHARRRSSAHVLRHRVVHRARRRAPDLRDGWLLDGVWRLMATVRLVRHGRATGGWDADPDPGLDAVGLDAGRRGGRRGSRHCATVTGRTSSPARCGGAARRPPRWPRRGGSNRSSSRSSAELPSPAGRPVRASGCRGCRRRSPGRGPPSAARTSTTATPSSATSPGSPADTIVVVRTSSPSTPSSAHCVGDDRVMMQQPRQHVGDGRRDVDAGRSALVRIGAEADTQIR